MDAESVAGARPRVRLNLRRLTTHHLKRLGRVLGPPAAAVANKLRQMIEGKLTGNGREPRNVQVVLDDVGSKSGMSLENEGGVFLQISVEEISDWEEQDGNSEESEREEDGVETLRAALLEAVKEIES